MKNGPFFYSQVKPRDPDRERQRIELTLSDETVAALDQLAKARDTSRSKIVDYAVKCLVNLEWKGRR